MKYDTKQGLGPCPILTQKRWLDWPSTPSRSKPRFLIIYAAHYCQQRPAAWQGVTWGLDEGFVKWLLHQGYSLASVNNRLSAVKVYARLAAKAGVIPPTEHALIGEVRGYGRTEGKRVDEVRPKVRVGNKKKEAIVLTAGQARQFKTQHPPTPQGIRDRLLIGLLLELGLRASEVAALTVDDLAEPGYLTVYRQKTDTTDRMELTADLLSALADYETYMRQSGTLLRGSRKNGELTNQVMSVRAIGSRVKILGRDILGLWELSPHDLRPTWATSGPRERPKRAIPSSCAMPAAGPICRRPAVMWSGHRWLMKAFGWIIDHFTQRLVVVGCISKSVSAAFCPTDNDPYQLHRLHG